MTAAELGKYRQKLLVLRNRLGGDVSHLTGEALHRDGDRAGGNLSNVPIHMADLGTDNYEQENTLKLLAKERQLLEEIEAALERIDQGAFGVCEECSGPIVPAARLEELPYARFCVACARQLDKGK